MYPDDIFCSFCGSQQIYDFGKSSGNFLIPDVLSGPYAKEEKVKKLDDWDIESINTMRNSFDLSDLTVVKTNNHEFLRTAVLSIIMFCLPFIFYIVIAHYLGI